MKSSSCVVTPSCASTRSSLALPSRHRADRGFARCTMAIFATAAISVSGACAWCSRATSTIMSRSTFSPISLRLSPISRLESAARGPFPCGTCMPTSSRPATRAFAFASASRRCPMAGRTCSPPATGSRLTAATASTPLPPGSGISASSLITRRRAYKRSGTGLTRMATSCSATTALSAWGCSTGKAPTAPKPMTT